MLWAQFLVDSNLELRKIPWKTTTFTFHAFNQVPKRRDSRFI